MNLRGIRQEKGYTQKEVADALNLQTVTYNRYETGARDIPVTILTDLADFYGVTVDDLVRNDTIVSSATITTGITLDDEEKILIANYRKALPEYQAVAQQILGNPENQRREKVSSSAG